MTLTPVRTFPKQVTLSRSGISVSIRPLEQGDEVELLAFFSRVSENDRFYLKEDVTSPDVIEGWVTHIDYRRVLPLVALVEGEIVADATLHRSRAGCRSHMGEVRIVVDPRYRDKGLGTTMLREIIDLSYDNDLDSLLFELVEGKEDSAVRVAEALGFTRVATIPRSVRDLDSNLHNLIIMQLPLGEWLEWWAF